MIAPPRVRVRSCDDQRKSCFRLILLRHPQAGLHGRFCGHSDPELSEEGRRAIAGIVSHLDGTSLSAVWSSDLVRAKASATSIAEHFGVTCKFSVALREMNFGLWEGLSWKEVEERFPEDARSWIQRFPHHRPSGGESFVEFQSRVIAELKRLATFADGWKLVVTHAGFIQVATAWALAIPDGRISRIAVDYCGAVVLQKTGEYWTVGVPNSIEWTCSPGVLTAEESRA